MLLLGGSVLCLHRPVPSESNAKLAISILDTSWLDGSGDLEIRYRPGIQVCEYRRVLRLGSDK